MRHRKLHFNLWIYSDTTLFPHQNLPPSTLLFTYTVHFMCCPDSLCFPECVKEFCHVVQAAYIYTQTTLAFVTFCVDCRQLIMVKWYSCTIYMNIQVYISNQNCCLNIVWSKSCRNSSNVNENIARTSHSSIPAFKQTTRTCCTAISIRFQWRIDLHARYIMHSICSSASETVRIMAWRSSRTVQ